MHEVPCGTMLDFMTSPSSMNVLPPNGLTSFMICGSMIRNKCDDNHCGKTLEYSVGYFAYIKWYSHADIHLCILVRIEPISLEDICVESIKYPPCGFLSCAI